MSARNERVPGFVYLDMERVKSISARLDEGFVKERIEEETESEKETERIMGRIRGFLVSPAGGVGSTVEGENTSTETSGSRTESSKAFHHYHVTLLEDWLEDFEGDWFHDLGEKEGKDVKETYLQEQVSEGDIIRIKTDLHLQDFESSFEILNGFLDSADDIEEFLGKISQIDGEGMINEEDVQDWEDMKDFQQIVSVFRPMFNMFEEILPADFSQMVVGQASLGDSVDRGLWALLNENNLESNPVELTAKYQHDSIPGATIIARVDNITEPPSGEGVDADEADIGQFLQLMGDLGKNFGFKVSYPDISISPIAVHR
jgi:hypothetical protein